MTENDTTADVTPLTLTRMSAGGVTTGGVTSCTVTPKEPVEVFPSPSVAVQPTVVVPSANTEPEAGVQVTLTGPWGSVAPTV